MKITDAVSLITIATLLLSIFLRMRPKAGKTYAPLLWVQISGVWMLGTSLSWTYCTLDAAMGGRNYLNLTSHLLFLGASWVYTVVLAEPFFRNRPKPATLSNWIPAVAAAGATVSFVLLDADTTSRGMNAFTNEPAWIGYWVFNIMTLWVPAITLVPLLLRVVKETRIRSLVVVYWAMIIGYTASVAAMISYVITYFYPGLIIAREILVMITELGLMTALIAIPVLSHQKSAERSARQQAQQKAAARFQR